MGRRIPSPTGQRVEPVGTRLRRDLGMGIQNAMQRDATGDMSVAADPANLESPAEQGKVARGPTTAGIELGVDAWRPNG